MEGSPSGVKINSSRIVLSNTLNHLPFYVTVLAKGNLMNLDKESLTGLICKHCEFYKESDKDLECGAYKILKWLLEKRILSPEEISDALRE